MVIWWGNKLCLLRRLCIFPLLTAKPIVEKMYKHSRCQKSDFPRGKREHGPDKNVSCRRCQPAGQPVSVRFVYEKADAQCEHVVMYALCGDVIWLPRNVAGHVLLMETLACSLGNPFVCHGRKLLTTAALVFSPSSFWPCMKKKTHVWGNPQDKVNMVSANLCNVTWTYSAATMAYCHFKV